MGFPGPWGKNPFSRQIIGAALSCHCFTQCTKPSIIGKDNVLHVTDSPKKRSPQLNPPSLNPLLGKRSTWMARGGGEGEELFSRGDNHVTQEDDKTTTKATPQSLGE
jgi:hypothetical protein